MSDFENFKSMLSHGFPSNQNYIVKEDDGERGYKIIERKRCFLNGLSEFITYDQYIFDKNGGFINLQSMTYSIADNRKEL